MYKMGKSHRLLLLYTLCLKLLITQHHFFVKVVALVGISWKYPALFYSSPKELDSDVEDAIYARMYFTSSPPNCSTFSNTNDQG